MEETVIKQQDKMPSPAMHRTALLTGIDKLEKIQSTRVIIFGVGGVGSWSAEALIRSGIEQLTIVDSDLVCVTNINRQLQATYETIGSVKVNALKERLLDINPHAQITALQKIYDRDSADSFELEKFDYVIDAIDSLSSKVELIIRASQSGAKVFSALGASSKLDPMRIKVASLWNSEGCRLGRFVRKRLRRRGFNSEVTCIYSDELLPVYDIPLGCGTGNCVCPKSASGEEGEAHEWCSKKKQINGSMVHITGIFGFMLAGLIVQDIMKQQA